MKLGRRDTLLALALGALGMLACVAGLLRFFWRYRVNDLGWKRDLAPGEFYGLLGERYWHGFLTGFFLCFFLILTGYGIEAWKSRNRRDLS